ncbi:LADA_0D12882g1_1 [Lachancea dasiensis]|uniref:LADA_0D12882g1_1 n=1 Tax=Lachancea dasiensis TaxID=1072105 RepID=A0A1G4J8D0_9SACH|nr:LADA_0D12882g1_1 [Lachancea dasiensis]
MSGNPASFKSILAGVQRLREAHGADENRSGVPKAPTLSREPAQQKSPQQHGPPITSKEPVINAFNQQKDEVGNGQELTHLEDRKRKWGNQFGGTPTGSTQGKTVLVSASQRGNPLLGSLTNTSWRYVSPSGGNKVYYDYCIHGRNVVFLSLKYHKLHPEYISKKIQPLVKNSNNVLICVVDVDNSENILKDLNKACMFNGFALLLAFNFEQAAKYIMFMNR